MGSVIGAAIVIFIISSIFSGKVSFISDKAKNDSGLSVQNKTLADLIQADSDGDGVPDWEEALWGTDPHKKATFNGVPDAEYIANKKKELNIEQNNMQDEQNMTETQKFAQEFFTSFAALKASGQVDASTINNFSNALGQKVVDANLPDQYAEKDAKLASTDDVMTQAKYYSTIKSLFDKHKQDGLGNELGIVSGGLAVSGVPSDITSNQGKDITASETISNIPSSTPDSYNELLVIGQSYQDFAKQVMETNVPKGLLPYHLAIANSAYNTGVAVIGMQKMIDDPIVGLSGLSQYQKYSGQLITAVTKLQEALMR